MLEYAGSQRAGLQRHREGIALSNVVRSLDWVLVAGVVGLVAVGLLQLTPMGGEAGRPLSFDPHATRVVVLQLVSLLVYFAAALSRRFRERPAAGRWLNRLSGGVFIGLGVKVARG